MADLNGITGTGRVYRRFDTDNDIVTDQTFAHTRGLWSDNVGDLYGFYTGSLTDAQKEYYYSVYQSQSSACGSDVQFYVAWGHISGSGSYGGGGSAEDSPSRAIYSQYRLMCLDPDDNTFTFKSSSTATYESDNIYVVNIARARLNDKLDPGNWELSLAQLTGNVTASVQTGSIVRTLIDDSGDSDEHIGFLGVTSPVYNVVSGSITNGVYDSSAPAYGLVYPDLGIIVLDGTKLNAELRFGLITSSSFDGKNAFRLFTAISGAAAPTSGRSTVYPFSARNVEIVTTAYYFVRIRNSEFNYSNNPTYVTGSLGQLKIASFERNPKVYITTIGMYNDRYELLAVAKLSQAVQKSFTEESLVTVKLEY